MEKPLQQTFLDIDTQLKQILRGLEDCIEEKELRKKLEYSKEQGLPLRVKLGIDPSSPDIHVGHTVVLRKLRQFQDLGHQAVLIIGTYTAMVGDPTGRSKTRPQLTEREVERNAKTYLEQIKGILDLEKLEIRPNGEWFSKMSFQEILSLTAQTTLARMLERDDFTKRYQANQPIALHEFLYPLMQGYDSVVVKADIELGGTDQLFNLLMGRKLQNDAGQKPQICLTLPLIEGLDGVKKMSKSLGNAIGVLEEPNEIFGKTMSIPDAMLQKWFTLLTEVPMEDVALLCDPEKTHMREAKDKLARAIVASFHGEEAAVQASQEFVQRFREGKIPDDIPGWKLPESATGLMEVMVESQLASSKSEARRLIQQGGVQLLELEAGGEVQKAVIKDLETKVDKGFAGKILKVGKRRFLRFEG